MGRPSCPECGDDSAEADEWFAYPEDLRQPFVKPSWRCRLCGHRWQSAAMTRAETRRLWRAKSEAISARDSDMPNPSDTVVFRWLAAGDAGNLDAFDGLLHADAVIHAPRGLSTASAEEEKAVWRDALAAMPDLRHDVQDVVAEGDIEMARVVVTGTMSAGFAGLEGTGRSFRIDQAVITHLRDGKVAEAWEIADIGALEEQIGGD